MTPHPLTALERSGRHYRVPERPNLALVEVAPDGQLVVFGSIRLMVEGLEFVRLPERFKVSDSLGPMTPTPGEAYFISVETAAVHLMFSGKVDPKESP